MKIDIRRVSNGFLIEAENMRGKEAMVLGDILRKSEAQVRSELIHLVELLIGSSFFGESKSE